MRFHVVPFDSKSMWVSFHGQVGCVWGKAIRVPSRTDLVYFTRYQTWKCAVPELLCHSRPIFGILSVGYRSVQGSCQINHTVVVSCDEVVNLESAEAGPQTGIYANSMTARVIKNIKTCMKFFLFQWRQCVLRIKDFHWWGSNDDTKWEIKLGVLPIQNKKACVAKKLNFFSLGRR